MQRIAWLTDIHLNFLRPEAVEAFLQHLAEVQADAFLISGDIAEATDVLGYLDDLAGRLRRPIYFLLGNHDFYFGSIAEVRAQAAALCEQQPLLVYLTQQDVIELTPRVGLVGHDGWADARLGDYVRSPIIMSDHQLIAELAGMTKKQRRPVLERLGDEAAAHFRQVLPAALDRYTSVLLATHVPPLREACWHEGATSDDDWAPHFTCQAVGAAILELMAARPDRQLTVLCGHTHSTGECRPLENVLILTGGAQYGRPAVQRVLELE